MITIAAVSSVAYMAKADLLTGTSFEGLDVETAGTSLLGPDDGEVGGATYWAAAENADISQTIVTAYGGGAQYAGEVGRPDQFAKAGTGTAKFLKVDTTGRLTRNIQVDGSGNIVTQNLATASVFFDSLVQFTAAEDAPEVASGDKLVVWLQGTEGDNPATNLVITAGCFEGEMKRTNYVIDGITVDQNTWYRLTIKAIGNIVQDDQAAVAGFLVYLDGVPVAHSAESIGDYNTDLSGLTADAAALNSDKLLFPSLVQPGAAGCSTLTSVSFEGTGAVDDLSFSTATPGFLNVATFALEPTFVDEDTAIISATYAVDGGDAVVLKPDVASYGVRVGAQSLVVTVTVPEGYVVEGFTKGAAVVIEEETCYPYTKAFDVSEKDDGDTLAVTITVAEAGGDTGDFPAEWNSGDAVSDAIKTKFADWVEAGNDPTVTGAETAFLLGVEATGTEPELTAKIEIVDGKVVVTTEPALDNANGQVLLYKAATLEGLKRATPAKCDGAVTTDDDAGTAGFYKVTVGYPTAE